MGAESFTGTRFDAPLPFETDAGSQKPTVAVPSFTNGSQSRYFACLSPITEINLRYVMLFDKEIK